MTSYLDVMMQLITENGLRVDRQAELAGMMTRLKVTPFHQVTPRDRQRLKVLLDLQHHERERRRFAPINFGDDDQ